MKRTSALFIIIAIAITTSSLFGGCAGSFAPSGQLLNGGAWITFGANPFASIFPQQPRIQDKTSGFDYILSDGDSYIVMQQLTGFCVFPNAPSGWEVVNFDAQYSGPGFFGWRNRMISSPRDLPEFYIGWKGCGKGRLTLSFDYKNVSTGELFSNQFRKELSRMSDEKLSKHLFEKDKQAWWSARGEEHKMVVAAVDTSHAAVKDYSELQGQNDLVLRAQVLQQSPVKYEALEAAIHSMWVDKIVEWELAVRFTFMFPRELAGN